MEYLIKVKCEKCGEEIEKREYNRHGCNCCHYMSKAALKYTKEINEIKAMEPVSSRTIK